MHVKRPKMKKNTNKIKLNYKEIDQISFTLYITFAKHKYYF